jgi:hypothetical protein
MMLLHVPQADAVQEAPPRWRTRVRRGLRHAVAWLGLSVLAFATGIALDGAHVPPPFPQALFLAGVLLLLASIGVALCRAAVAIRDHSPAAFAGNLLYTLLGLYVAYMSTMGFSRGRQLRRFGRVLLPRLWLAPDWTTATLPAIEPEGFPAVLAEQWRENGKTEHASVAAFARLTLDLMALGAPPSLIAAANRDALDEIRHTELCFSIARGLDGKTVSPGPFPQAQRVATLPRARRLALAKLAVDSLVDGALHEGVSARIVARLARRCEVPAVRNALREIAADEGRHSAHGWLVVKWCVEEGGRPVAEALKGAVRALPREMRSALPAAAAGGQWERWGIHGHALEAEEYAAALAHVQQRVQALAAGPASRVA